MSGDKRSVSTDALETLGAIIGAGSGRDAIHIAVEPVIAAQTLRPGEDVGFVEGGVGICDKPLGIVDPFLKTSVRRGERFWMLVYPRQITSLRHVWSHPAFAEAGTVDMSESEAWIRSYAAAFPVRYEELLERATNYVKNDEYWSEGGRFEGEYLNEEFWTHYQRVTETIVPADKQNNFFSCSC